MNCIVTAGPTCEKMDSVRRLTNFSTGRLGTELANFLTAQGHDVTLLVGESATFPGQRLAQRVEKFGATAELQEWLQALASPSVNAVFHAAAVSDFTFGKIWHRAPDGGLGEVRSGKISTREGVLLAELVPTPKLIGQLRGWFPQARIAGWKFEVDGDCAGVIRAAEKQLAENLTDACVANGPAYGSGFGLVRRGGGCEHLPEAAALFRSLEMFATG
jgi:phosphopantothenoylcysteine decarboxylase/phosphopantothenate--cysteine ligase